jgi:hypothetical protein
MTQNGHLTTTQKHRPGNQSGSTCFFDFLLASKMQEHASFPTKKKEKEREREREREACYDFFFFFPFFSFSSERLKKKRKEQKITGQKRRKLV